MYNLFSYSVNMVTKMKRNDTAVRISKWLDEAVEVYISDKKVRLAYPSKRNFVDNAVARLLEEKGVEVTK